MLNSMLSNASSAAVSTEEFLLCMGAAAILGIGLAWVHQYRNHCTKNFMMTLALLPVMVQTVIMLVNGNLGTGIAVMGAFSLVRFRSLPGNSREIGSVFLAMAVGLAAGMGYLGIAALLFLVVGIATVVFQKSSWGTLGINERELKITIPDNLDYTGIFDDLFEKYTKKAELKKVRTINMGSLYELSYGIELKQSGREKEMLDEIRCRNGNLNLICARAGADGDGL